MSSISESDLDSEHTEFSPYSEDEDELELFRPSEIRFGSSHSIEYETPIGLNLQMILDSNELEGPYEPPVSVVPTTSQLKRRASSPIPFTQVSDDEDGNTCIICFERWTNSGPHRLVSLQCGHLFGKTCIERWSRQTPKCPTCHKSIHQRDIRIIYARSLSAVDTTEMNRLKQELEDQTRQRKRIEITLADTKLKCQMLELEIKKCKDENENLRNISKVCRSDSSTGSGFCTDAERSIQKMSNVLIHEGKIHRNQGGRIVVQSKSHGLILYSRESPTSLFRGHGISKVNLGDPRMTEYISLHSQIIRDLSSNERTGTLLSCGMDCMARLVDLRTNFGLSSYLLPSPAWSCTWMDNSDFYFYVGSTNGTVYMFDCRMDAANVQELIPFSSKPSPVASLQTVCSPSSLNRRALFVGNLLKAGIYSCEPPSPPTTRLSATTQSQSQKQVDHTYHAMATKGSIMSADFDRNTYHLAVSLRPTTDYPYVRHEVYHTGNYDDLSFVATIQGSRSASFLTRARLLQSANGSMMVCAYDEQHQCIDIRDVSNSTSVQQIKGVKRVADICPIYRAVSSTDETILASISPDAFRLHRICYID